jgi:very-short-patch-repair endonuclease
VPKKSIHNLSYLKSRRKELRNNLTSAEAALWIILKSSQLKGRKFRRQHSIENYIVDFFCPSEKLIIELDGQVHFNSVAELADKERDKRLEELGYTVLRFENKTIFQSPEWVVAEIEKHFK